MRNIIVTLLLPLVFTTTMLQGCGFVDIDTPGQIDGKKMYADEQGFEDVLTGIYATLAKPNLYGRQLSFGFVDEIAQLYYNDHEAALTTLTKTYDLQYRDTDVRKQIDRIWESAFFAVYTINDLLQQAEGKHFARLDGYKGEALALRAMLHFDMLRLFAPNYSRPHELSIPYVTKTSTQPSPRLTVDECYQHILADLNKADSLLASSSAKRTPAEMYVSRYAIKALKARVYIWAGNKSEAARYAKEVTEGPYRMVKEEKVLQLFMGYAATSECVWVLNAPKAYLDVRQAFYPARSTATCNMVRNNYKRLFSTSTFTPTNNDYRFQAYFTQTNWGRPIVAFTKLYDKNYEETQEWQAGRIPGINMIRLPEMYYILAEALYDTDRNASLEALNTVITARGLQPLSSSEIATPERFRQVLVDEIKKEYWGEGQIFFTYKRFEMPMEGLNSKVFEPTDATYILPLPQSEENKD